MVEIGFDVFPVGDRAHTQVYCYEDKTCIILRYMISANDQPSMIVQQTQLNSGRLDTLYELSCPD